VSSLQYSLRLQELVLGVFAVSVATVMLPTLSEQVLGRQWDEVKSTLRFSIGLLAFVTVPATIGLMLLATPIVRLLFEYGRFDARSTELTVQALYWHTAGIFFIAMQRNVVQVFYAMKDLKTPTIVSAVVMVVHLGLCYGLAIPLQNGGIAAAGSVAAVLNVVLLYWILRRRIGHLGTRSLVRALVHTGVASAAMAAVVVGALAAGWLDVEGRTALALRLLPLIGAAVAVYFVAARAVGSEELTEFGRLLRRKAGKGAKTGA
jgi:putative peptidoglycan lipid II flippase